MAQLIEDPKGPAEQRHPLRPGINTLGRSRESTIVLADSSVSRRHAEIELRGRRALLKDLDSTNHCYVNGARVDATELQDGDELRLGDVTLLYSVVDSDPVSTSMRPESELAPALADGITPERREELQRTVREPGALRRASAAAGASLLRLTADSGPDPELAKLRTLLRVSNRLSVPAPLREVMGRALAQLLELVAVDRATVLMRDPVSAQLAPRAFQVRPGIAADGIIRNLELAESALVKGGPVLSAESPTGIQSKGDGEPMLHISLCLPLIADDATVGVLCVENLALPSVYGDEEVAFMTGMAGQIGVALAHARRVDELLEQARAGAR